MSEQHMKLGFAGIGRMGEAMVLRLLMAGYPVTVWNRTPEKLAAVAAAGATVAASLADVAAEADAVFTMVTDDAAVEALHATLMAGEARGKLFIDMSTILPQTVKRLAAAAVEKGGGFVDAPVAGTVQPARDGQLLIFAGGDAADVQTLKPVFDVLARRVEYLGPSGSGAAMKLVHNALLCTFWSILGEAMAMGSHYGLDFKRMLDVIGESPAAFAGLPVKIPILVGQSAETGFDMANVLKDLRTITAFAASLGVPMPIGQATMGNYEAALEAGFGAQDVASIVRFHQMQGPA